MSRDGRAHCWRCCQRTRSRCATRWNGCGTPQDGAPALTGVPGATLLVGGIPALNADYQTLIKDHVGPVMALVVGGTLLALFSASVRFSLR